MSLYDQFPIGTRVRVIASGMHNLADGSEGTVIAGPHTEEGHVYVTGESRYGGSSEQWLSASEFTALDPTTPAPWEPTVGQYAIFTPREGDYNYVQAGEVLVTAVQSNRVCRISGPDSSGNPTTESVYTARLSAAEPLTAANADTLDKFKRLVVQEALKRKRQHSLCQELNRYLTDEEQGLGLAAFIPKRAVTVTATVLVEEQGQDDYTRARAETLLIEALPSGIVSAIETRLP